MGAPNQLAATRLDRLARSTRDLLNVPAAIARHGAGFKILKDTWADTTTPHGGTLCSNPCTRRHKRLQAAMPASMAGVTSYPAKSRSLHDRQRLPRLKAEPRVKAVGEQQRDSNAELLGRHLINAQLDFRDLLFGRTIGFSPFRMRPV